MRKARKGLNDEAEAGKAEVDVEALDDQIRDHVQGLSAALTSAARCAAPGVTVRGHDLRRCRQEVETAVYFSCLAALDNATKHAGEGRVSISLTDTGDALRFVVRDWGAGFRSTTW